MRKYPYQLWVILFLLGAAQLACNMPGFSQPTETGANALYTAAAQTVAAQMTQVNNPLVTTIPSTIVPGLGTFSPTVVASSTLPPGVTPSATATPRSCNSVKFIKDVTFPDNTEVPPNSEFTKVWRIKNEGTCIWTTLYGLAFVDGDKMGAPDYAPLSTLVAPGEEVDISVQLTSPIDPGTFRGEYKLRDADGKLFGLGDGSKPFWVQIKVKTKTGLLYDFLSQAKNAEWVSGVGGETGTTLLFNGDDNDPNGVAKIKDALKLETGATSGKVLLTFPKHQSDGFVLGTYPAYLVQSGDHLKGKLGFVLNPGDTCGSGKVKFQIYTTSGAETKLLREWGKTCDGRFIDVDLNLSELKGKSVQFILRLNADGSFEDDWAIWNSLRIEQ